jgi:hypothetical protein
MYKRGKICEPEAGPRSWAIPCATAGRVVPAKTKVWSSSIEEEIRLGCCEAAARSAVEINGNNNLLTMYVCRMNKLVRLDERARAQVTRISTRCLLRRLFAFWLIWRAAHCEWRCCLYAIRRMRGKPHSRTIPFLASTPATPGAK